MSQTRAIIFDLDGTLIDSALTILAIVNELRVERSAGPLQMAEIRPHLSKGGRALVRSSLAEVARDADADLTLFRERYATVVQGPEIVFREAEQILESLRAAGHPLGVCTNKPALLARNALHQTGLARFFDAIIAAEPGTPPKPDPTSLLETCRRLRVDPRDAMLIGDSEADAEAAEAAGMVFVFVSHGYPVGDPAAIRRHHAIDRFADLPQVVARAAATGRALSGAVSKAIA